MTASEARTIAVANEKGGVGKTVTVLNLGAALTLEGKTVLIVDMDPQANATKGLGIEVTTDTVTIYDLISASENVSADAAVVSTPWAGLSVIPSHVDLSGAEVELVDEPGRENRLGRAMTHLEQAFDFILLDTPPSLSLLTVNVLTFANEILIPCQTHPYAYDALAELFDTIAAVQAEINPTLRILGIVPTLFDVRTRVSRRILDKLYSDDRYRDYLFKTIIRVNTTIADSADVCKPVVFYRSRSFGAVDYRSLARELLSIP